MFKLPRNYIVKSRRQSGQALLLILLVMSLVLTLVMSSVSRGVTDVEVSTSEEESIRAFDAAQAGIERSVVALTTPAVSVALDSGATFVADKDIVNSVQYFDSGDEVNYFKYPLELLSGESATLFFVSHKEDANGDYVMTCDDIDPLIEECISPARIRFNWGRPGTLSDGNTTPALYMEFYYNSDSSNPDKWEDLGDLSDVQIATISADPNASRRWVNNFQALTTTNGIPSTIDDYSFTSLYEKGVDYVNVPIGALLFVKVTMLYNDTPQPLGVTSAASLPPQGYNLTSTGQSSDIYRKLVLFQGYPEVPFEFGNAVYSKNSLTK